MKIIRIIVLTGLLLGLYSCETKAEGSDPKIDAHFVHVVYFWLNNPEDPEDREKFVSALKQFLNTSLYAKTNFIGTPANTPRDVVDNSWTYSIILSFPSKEIQDSYQKEAAHLQFIEQASHLWERVQVYDAVGLSED